MLASDRPAPSARPRDIDYIRVAEPAPVVLAYGIGVDSTALLVELESRGTPPDLVITGDPGIEKPETYVYQEMMAAWMAGKCPSSVMGLSNSTLSSVSCGARAHNVVSSTVSSAILDAAMPPSTAALRCRYSAGRAGLGGPRQRVSCLQPAEAHRTL